MDAAGKDIAYIENKTTGQKMWMRQRHGVYVLDVLVAPPEYKKEEPQNKSGTGQGGAAQQEHKGPGGQGGGGRPQQAVFGRQGSHW